MNDIEVHATLTRWYLQYARARYELERQAIISDFSKLCKVFNLDWMDEFQLRAENYWQLRYTPENRDGSQA